MQPGEYRLGCPLMVVIWLVSIPLTGLAIASCWNWFVVPVTNFPQMTLGAAIGFRIFVLAIWQTIGDDISDEARRRYASMSFADVLWKTAERFISPPLFVLALAWAWRSIMAS